MPSRPARWASVGSPYEVDLLQAGTIGHARVEVENAGAAAWHELIASYHWLDDLGNPIHWDGLRTPLPTLAPGERTAAELDVQALMPSGRYRLAFDLVLEHRYWLSEIGNEMLEIEVDVGVRDASPAVAHLPRGSSQPRTGTTSSALRTRRGTPP